MKLNIQNTQFVAKEEKSVTLSTTDELAATLSEKDQTDKLAYKLQSLLKAALDDKATVDQIEAILIDLDSKELLQFFTDELDQDGTVIGKMMDDLDEFFLYSPKSGTKREIDIKKRIIEIFMQKLDIDDKMEFVTSLAGYMSSGLSVKCAKFLLKDLDKLKLRTRISLIANEFSENGDVGVLEALYQIYGGSRVEFFKEFITVFGKEESDQEFFINYITEVISDLDWSKIEKNFLKRIWFFIKENGLSLDYFYKLLLLIENKDFFDFVYEEFKKFKYDFYLMLDDTRMEKNKIYVRKKADFLEYRLLDNNGKLVESKITQRQLKHNISENFDIDELKEISLKIFLIILKRGHVEADSRFFLYDDPEDKGFILESLEYLASQQKSSKEEKSYEKPSDKVSQLDQIVARHKLMLCSLDNDKQVHSLISPFSPEIRFHLLTSPFPLMKYEKNTPPLFSTSILKPKWQSMWNSLDYKQKKTILSSEVKFQTDKNKLQTGLNFLIEFSELEQLEKKHILAGLILLLKDFLPEDRFQLITSIDFSKKQVIFDFFGYMDLFDFENFQPLLTQLLTGLKVDQIKTIVQELDFGGYEEIRLALGYLPKDWCTEIITLESYKALFFILFQNLKHYYSEKEQKQTQTLISQINDCDVIAYIWKKLKLLEVLSFRFLPMLMKITDKDNVLVVLKRMQELEICQPRLINAIEEKDLNQIETELKKITSEEILDLIALPITVGEHAGENILGLAVKTVNFAALDAILSSLPSEQKHCLFETPFQFKNQVDGEIQLTLNRSIIQYFHSRNDNAYLMWVNNLDPALKLMILEKCEIFNFKILCPALLFFIYEKNFYQLKVWLNGLNPQQKISMLIKEYRDVKLIEMGARMNLLSMMLPLFLIGSDFKEIVLLLKRSYMPSLHFSILEFFRYYLKLNPDQFWAEKNQVEFQELVSNYLKHTFSDSKIQYSRLQAIESRIDKTLAIELHIVFNDLIFRLLDWLKKNVNDGVAAEKRAQLFENLVSYLEKKLKESQPMPTNRIDIVGYANKIIHRIVVEIQLLKKTVLGDQSIHLASINYHTRVSIQKLKSNYDKYLDTPQKRTAVMIEMTKRIKTLCSYKESLKLSSEIKAQYQVAASYIDGLAEDKLSYIPVALTPQISLTLNELLPLLWVALHDEKAVQEKLGIKNKEDSSESPVELAEQAFIAYLFDIRRAYNSHNIFSKDEADSPSCAGGAIDRITTVLSLYHPDISCSLVTSESACQSAYFITQQVALDYLLHLKQEDRARFDSFFEGENTVQEDFVRIWPAIQATVQEKVADFCISLDESSKKKVKDYLERKDFATEVGFFESDFLKQALIENPDSKSYQPFKILQQAKLLEVREVLDVLRASDSEGAAHLLVLLNQHHLLTEQNRAVIIQYLPQLSVIQKQRQLAEVLNKATAAVTLVSLETIFKQAISVTSSEPSSALLSLGRLPVRESKEREIKKKNKRKQPEPLSVDLSPVTAGASSSSRSQGLYASNQQVMEAVNKALQHKNLGALGLGEASRNGDCFFESWIIALGDQSLFYKLDQLKHPMRLKAPVDVHKSSIDFVKKLRILCHQAMSEIDKSNPSENWIKTWVNSELKQDYKKYISGIAFTSSERADNPNMLIWGSAEIEGRLLCKALGVQLHVMVITDEGLVNHQWMTENDVQTIDIDETDLTKGSDVLHLALYKQHFVPLVKNGHKKIALVTSSAPLTLVHKPTGSQFFQPESKKKIFVPERSDHLPLSALLSQAHSLLDKIIALIGDNSSYQQNRQKLLALEKMGPRPEAVSQLNDLIEVLQAKLQSLTSEKLSL